MSIVTRRALLATAGLSGLALAAGSSGRSASADEGVFPLKHSDAEWRRLLSPDQFAVLRRAGTETPYSSPLNHEKRDGLFACGGCDQPAFSSATKFDSHTGWPSFWQPLQGAVEERQDRSLLMARTEVHCSRCGGHLGHVFSDGPQPTGLRYCMNGVALRFSPGTPS